MLRDWMFVKIFFGEDNYVGRDCLKLVKKSVVTPLWKWQNEIDFLTSWIKNNS